MARDGRHEVERWERAKDAKRAQYLAHEFQGHLIGILKQVLKAPIRASLATADGAIYVYRDGEKGGEFQPVFVPEGVVGDAVRFPLNLMYEGDHGKEEINIIGIGYVS